MTDLIKTLKDMGNEKVRVLPGQGCCRKPGRPKRSEYVLIKRKDLWWMRDDHIAFHILKNAFTTTLKDGFPLFNNNEQ